MPHTARFKEFADAFQRHFGATLEINDKMQLSDGETTGVTRVGSVRSNWVKRNAPKYGFVRAGDSATLRSTQVTANEETEAAVEAERSEIEAVVSATSMLSSEQSASTPEEVYHENAMTGSEELQADAVEQDEEDS